MNLPVGIRQNVDLAKYTSWRVGGPADFFAEPKNLDELKLAVAFAVGKNLPITILSGGSNVLISDIGIRGLTIVMAKMSECRVLPAEIVVNSTEDVGAQTRFQLECHAGTSKSEILKHFLKAKLQPALFLAGIPGDVGGGIAMNAGIGEQLKPREFVEITDWIDVLRWQKCGDSREQKETLEISRSSLEFEIVRFRKAELRWSYRHCDGWQPGIIVAAGLSWPNEGDSSILEQVKKLNTVRASRQPLDMPSCGSVFKNPEGLKAGQLIEQAGLKGYAIGGAQVSQKHANFVVNTGHAKASEIDAVIRHVQSVVKSVNGVELTTEVVYLGVW